MEERSTHRPMSTGEQFVYSILGILLAYFCFFIYPPGGEFRDPMTRRLFNLLLPLVPASLLAKTEPARGVTVTLTGLDPRFVAQQRIAAKSRGLSLEGWMVHAALIMSGYDLNNGFIHDQPRGGGQQ